MRKFTASRGRELVWLNRLDKSSKQLDRGWEDGEEGDVRLCFDMMMM